MTSPSNCVFCKIVRGELPAVKLFEDEHVFAFMDILPASPGHALVIAKAHHVNLLDMPDEPLAATALAVRRLARAIDIALKPDGFQIRQFNGAPAGQTVFHYHVHIVPIRAGAPAGMHGRDKASMDELEALANRIRVVLA